MHAGCLAPPRRRPRVAPAPEPTPRSASENAYRHDGGKFRSISSAPNDRLVKAIVDEVELQVDRAGGPKPRRIEGLQDRLWVLMDYGDVVVHVFQQDQREFYDLERLWADVPRVDWSEPAA